MGVRTSLVGGVAVCLLFVAGVARAEVPPDVGASADAADEDRAGLLARADGLYARRELGPDGPSLEALTRLLEEAARRHPDDYEIQWRLARVLFWRADGAAGDRRSELGKAAAEVGDRARALAPNDVKGHYYAAASVGLWSQGMGILKALTKGMEGKFRERLDRAVALDPSYDCGGPLITLGRYYYELPWPKYDGTASLEALRKALQVCPDNVRAMTYLAETLHKEDQEERARSTLDRALAVDPAAFEDPPEARRSLREARTVRARLE